MVPILFFDFTEFYDIIVYDFTFNRYTSYLQIHLEMREPFLGVNPNIR